MKNQLNIILQHGYIRETSFPNMKWTPRYNVKWKMQDTGRIIKDTIIWPGMHRGAHIHTQTQTHTYLQMLEIFYRWKDTYEIIRKGTEFREMKVRLTFHSMNSFELRILSYVLTLLIWKLSEIQMRFHSIGTIYHWTDMWWKWISEKKMCPRSLYSRLFLPRFFSLDFVVLLLSILRNSYYPC